MVTIQSTGISTAVEKSPGDQIAIHSCVYENEVKIFFGKFLQMTVLGGIINDKKER